MNKFKVLKEIGRGTYGRALLVKDVNSGDLKVVKEFILSDMSYESRDSAYREVEILSSLNHTNIIRYRGCSKQKNCMYILMDYADGGDLAMFIRNRGTNHLSEDEILYFFVQILLAIKYLHDKRILHRDLKPQNVFLCQGSIVKLGDFGIARSLEHTNDMAQTAIGTPLYCSPEICMGKKYNLKSDIWSLGVILYELCTFTKPFLGRNIGEVVSQIIHKQHENIPSIYSKELKDLVDSMLAKNPDERPSVNDIFKLSIIRNKAIAILGFRLEDHEMYSEVLYDHKLREEIESYKSQTVFKIHKQKSPKKENTGLKHFMKKLAKNLEAAIQGDDHNVTQINTENDINGDFYFMGRKLILKGVEPTDPLTYKIESLRHFLEELLGVEKFKNIYDVAHLEDDCEKILTLTESDIYAFQLVMQLVTYENVLLTNT